MTSSPVDNLEKYGRLGVTFDEASEDSPFYRANLMICEDEIDILVKWIESLVKLLKDRIDEAEGTFRN
jgi:hypothetical protein